MKIKWEDINENDVVSLAHIHISPGLYLDFEFKAYGVYVVGWNTDISIKDLLQIIKDAGETFVEFRMQSENYDEDELHPFTKLRKFLNNEDDISFLGLDSPNFDLLWAQTDQYTYLEFGSKKKNIPLLSALLKNSFFGFNSELKPVLDVVLKDTPK